MILVIKDQMSGIGGFGHRGLRSTVGIGYSIGIGAASTASAAIMRKLLKNQARLRCSACVSADTLQGFILLQHAHHVKNARRGIGSGQRRAQRLRNLAEFEIGRGSKALNISLEGSCI